MFHFSRKVETCCSVSYTIQKDKLIQKSTKKAMNYSDCAIIKGKIEIELRNCRSFCIPHPSAVHLQIAEYLQIPNYNLDMYLVKSC